MKLCKNFGQKPEEYIIVKKTMDSTAFIILQGIIAGLLNVICTSKINSILITIFSFIYDNNVGDNVHIINILSILDNIQVSALKTFIFTMLVSIIISLAITLVALIVVKGFKHEVNFNNMFYVTGIWCIMMIPIILLSFILFLINIKLAVIFCILSAMAAYIFLVWTCIYNNK